MQESKLPAPGQSTGLQLETADEVSLKSPDSEISFSDPIAFMHHYAPQGPWCLTTYSPNNRGGSYLPSSSKDALAFVKQWDGKQDIYFLLGIPEGKPAVQPTKEVMRGSAWLWVDLDPRAGKNLQEERQRILARLTKDLPKGVPVPTCIIDSGRGYWALWQLHEPCMEPALVERYNERLAGLFGADKCWNINRVGRLPGTVNLKTKKRSGVVIMRDIKYSLAEMPTLIADTVASPTGEKPTVLIAAAQGVDDLSILEHWKVPERIKRIIEYGRVPEEGVKKGDDSRSAWLFDALCHLVRSGVPDEIMLGLLTDAKWKISASIFHQSNGKTIYNPEKRALRQISNAKREVAAESHSTDFECNDKGVPYSNSQKNIRTALYRLGIRVRYDRFHDRLLIKGLEGFGPLLDDEAMTRLWLMIDEQFGFRPGKDFFWSVTQDMARRDDFHPVLDYLESLDWDGTYRLDGWLTQYGGAVDSPYTRAVGSLMLIAAVRRIRSPGCKFDEMLVLEGEQGTNKSSALAIMAVHEDWFSDDLPLNAEGKRVIEALAGRWIIEAAELKGMRKGDIEHLKSFLSRNKDRARMSYDRLNTEVSRQCIIVGTTNSAQYLRDGTGNRRFWPVQVARFNLDTLRQDRDQLWAEAAHLEEQGESIRLAEKLWPSAAQEQQKREVEDPYLQTMQEALGDMSGKIAAQDVWNIIGLPAASRTQEHNSRIGEAMKKLGWERKRLRLNGRVKHGYVRGREDERNRRIIVRVYEDGEVQVSYEGQDGVKEPFQ